MPEHLFKIRPILNRVKTNGPLLMLVAAFLFTLMSVMVKVLPSGYSPLHIGFIRCFGGMVVLLAVNRFDISIFNGWNKKLLVLRGFTGTATFLAAIAGVRALPISTATVIFYSFPVFAAIFGWILYKEALNFLQAVCMVIVFAGVAVMFGFDAGGTLYGKLMAFSGALFAGITVTLIRTLKRKNGPTVIYLYFCMIGTLITFPFFAANPFFPDSFIEVALIAGIILTSVIAQLMMNQGFSSLKAWEGSVFMSSETLFTAAFGIFIMDDPVSFRFFCGGAMILLSGVVLNLIRTKS